jgi:nucleoside-diphosphate-sugar epimerase
MRVLLTGGAGYVGSVTAHALLDDGHAVRILDSLLHGSRGVLGLYARDGVEFVRGDIRDAAGTDAALEGVDAVVHLAAIVGDPACARDPELSREVNRDASIRLFEASVRRGVERFVFASTCSNYGRMADALDYVDEEAELRPLSVYAETKVEVEQMLLAQRTPVAGTVLRFATVYGLSPRPRFDLTVNEFAAELGTTRRLVVYGEQFWRPYVHVRDAARAIGLVLAADTELVAGEVFNVGSTAENYRKEDIVELVCRELNGAGVEIERVHRAEDPRDYRVSFERIRTRLGFEPTRTVPDGIREVLSAVSAGVFADLADPEYRN